MKLNDLTGKTAIVTGAAQGLSCGMAEGLMEAGAKVCIMDINPKAEETAKQFVEKVMNVRQSLQILEMMKQEKQLFHKQLKN